MSHSKFRKRGQSLYLDHWNPAAKKYIHVCCLCGRTGYSPAIEEPGFVNSPERTAIYTELTKMFSASLVLDPYCRCRDCAKMQKRGG